MTVFTRTWDGSYEAVPATIEDAALGAQRIREFKLDIRERFAVDHSLAGDTADGEHLKITFKAQIADPANVADKGFLYIKDAAAKVELFWRDEDGNIVQLTNAGALNAVAYAHPAGLLAPFAGTVAPTAWLLCHGQEVSRTTFSLLFSAVGTTYGIGNGTTTFNLPDLRGRVIAGQDDMGGVSANRLTNQSGGVEGDTLGAAGGAETHTLTEGELAEHDHLVASTGSPNGQTPTSSNRIAATAGDGQNPAGVGFAYALAGTSSAANIALSSAVGGGGAHNNVQPTMILNYVISTGGQT